LASLPGYFYSTSKDGIYAHLFHNSELNWHLEDGTPIKIVQRTEYPWRGEVEFEVSPAKAVEITLYVRKQDWSDRAFIVSHPAMSDRVTDGYIPIRRQWFPGSKFTLRLDMKPQLLESNARVVENTGRVAVQRGPLVYCLEELDQPAGTSLADVS